MKQDIIIASDLKKSLTEAIERVSHDHLFVLTDTNTEHYCWPLIKDFAIMQGAQMITIAPTDEAKNISTLTKVWSALQEGGASRHSLMVNLGGGMVTDLGGFAASTFKRGMAYINIPTTLLAQVDASVGGKTGINFGGLKNEIGVFNCASSVILSSAFLRTLDKENLLSGYAEMLKHGLLSTKENWAELLCFDITNPDFDTLQMLVAKSVAIKEEIVNIDPTEKGIRKALNLGHTSGHALESLALEEGRTILHGYAVAWGLMMELYLSAKKCNFPAKEMHQLENFVKEHYGKFLYECKHYDTLYKYMTHDKKNENGNINFTLMGAIGDIRINQTATKDEIEEMLDYYREN
ncbi:MAG: 3-dehydroquinate synthase [Bacteroidaceae bacterium]|nr:3-dehydroquinate synthase [Bacteroidaceae bacterium]